MRSRCGVEALRRGLDVCESPLQGSRPAIDLDVQEGGGGGNIDMQAQPVGAAAALLLQADDAQLFK